ncbi:FoF1 ATP synthase subunit gamma [Methylocapsa polymorpha]|uniref:FoF1 ATP synthase subunit gamma n=1 Tax=Methylocapsa polymorpha TaxID=3080828 RepID=A0ABZ0HVL0_9HYPH|nr:FoF1 ATP synthase subunit gamma [Methylocapsa sp. RX1]
MTRLAEIQAHIGSMGELRDIVGAMRSLAGMRVQEAQHALPGISRYADAMAAAIGGALLLMPQSAAETRADRDGRALILYTAEHGFVGGFNERLMEAAEAALAPGDALFVLGTRGGALALERGRRVIWMCPMATRLAAVPDTIRRLSTEIYARIARGQISRVEAMFAHYRQGGAATIERSLLLPLDLEKLQAKETRQEPLHNLEPQALLEKLMSEYVFALLTKAAVESLASENAARFAAMESAHDNVSVKLDKLRQDEREARQSEITTELLELITGAEALREE